MVFSPDELLPDEGFAKRLDAVLSQARAMLALDWVAVAELAAPTGRAGLQWRACAPKAAVDASAIQDVSRWRTAPAPGDPTVVPLAVSPPLGVSPDAVLVYRADQAPDPDALASLCTCLARGLSWDRATRLADWIFAAVEHSNDPVEITDRDAHLLYANAAWQRTFGFGPDEFLGRTPKQLFRTSEDPKVDEAFFRFALNTLGQGAPWLGTIASRAKDGTPVVAEAMVTPFRSAQGDLMGNVAIRRDLTHRAERDVALIVAHREFREVLAGLPDGVIVLRDDRIYFVNAAFLAIVACEEGSVISRTPADFADPADRAAVQEGRFGAPLRLLRPDGSTRLVEISIAGSASFDGAPATILLLRDTTDRRLSEARLVHGEKLAALGSLAAGIAHEINNPLAFVALNLEQLAEPSVDPGDVPVFAGEALQGIDRIRRIVEDMRGFSAVDPMGPTEVVNLGRAVGSAVNITANEIRHRARLVRDETPDLYVAAREGPLVQVLVAVLANAAQAVPGMASADHEIELRTRAIEPDRVEILISDTGIGIPAGFLSRVFEPFATTKGRDEGTGLGLAIARRIVEEFGGEIALRPRVGRGVTVTIRLPRATPGNAHAPDRSPDAEPVRPKRILVVDDDTGVTRAIARILEEHEVVVVDGGTTARAILMGAPQFDVVLCDLMMPDLPGPDLYRSVVSSRPELAQRFVFMTGGAFTESARVFADSVRTRLLLKPFDAQRLRSAIGL